MEQEITEKDFVESWIAAQRMTIECLSKEELEKLEKETKCQLKI